MQDVCEVEVDISPITNNHKNGVYEVWNSLYLITSSRARPILLGQANSESSSSTADSLNNNLQLKVLSELLDCAVHSKDKSRRRNYIGRIMNLSNTTQKVIMGMTEQRAPLPRSSAKKNRSPNRSPQRRTIAPSQVMNSQRRDCSPSKKSNSGSPEKTLRSASSYNSGGRSRRSSPSKSISKPTAAPVASPGPSLRGSAIHHTPCGAPGQVIARMNCGVATPSGVVVDDEATAVAQNLFGNGGTEVRPSAFKQQPQRSVGFEASPPGFLSPGTMESPQRLQAVLKTLQRKVDLQQQAMDMYQSTEEQMKQELECKEQEHRNAMIKLERESMHRLDETQSSLQEQIVELKLQLETVTDEARMGKSAVSELDAIREEMEVMQRSKTDLAKAHEMLRKYQDKLTEMADTKDALKREQKAHGNAVDEIVRLEQEIQKLNPEKRKAEEYKIRAIEAEVKLVECQDYMKRLEKKASEENSHFFKEIMMQKEQMDELRSRIQQDVATCKASGDAIGIGEGISEMNPELKEELTRLRSENVQLRAFQAKRAEDAVQHLEESLDDCERMMQKYKTEYLSTKDVLSTKKVELESANQRNADLQKEIQQYEEQCAQYKQRCERLESRLDNTSNQLEQTSQSLQNAEAANEKLSDDLQQWMKKKQETDKVIEKQRAEMREFQEMLTQSESDVQELNTEVQRLQQVCQEGSSANDQFRSNLEQLSREHTETKKRLSEKEDELEMLSHRSAQLQQDFERAKLDLQNERQLREEENANSRIALEATCEKLESQRKDELTAVEQNMKKLLEDERCASRQKEQELDEKFQSCDSTWSARYQDLREKSAATLQQSRQEHQEKIKSFTEKYNESLEKVKAEGIEKHADTMRKGKKLMETAKAAATAQILRLHEQLAEAESQCTRLHTEKSNIQRHFEDQLRKANDQINASLSEADERTRDLEEQQGQTKRLEREKFKLSQENEQFRRKLGGQYGSSGEVQSQLAKLRKEFNAVVEENRTLKKQARESSLDCIAEESDKSKSYRNRGGRINGQAMTELRKEFEEKIDQLNDEKRDLIMKMSSQHTDVSKAEQRLWDKEQEMKKLKNEILNLQLKLERTGLPSETNKEEMTRSMSPGKAAVSYNSPSRIPRSSPSKVHRSSPSIERAKRQKAAQEHLFRKKFQSVTGGSSIPHEQKVLSPRNKAVLPTPIDPQGDEDETGSASKNATEGVFRVKKSPTRRSKSSIVQATQMNNNSAPDEEAQPECNQS